MQLKCLQENLSHGLGIVQRGVATRTTLPITQHVLLASDEGRLKLSATNLEIAISTWVGGEINDDGAVTIPARLLIDFVNSLTPQTIEINTNAQGRGIEVKGDRFQSSINGALADEFPPIPSIGEGVTTRMSGAALKEAIHQVALAAAVWMTAPQQRETADLDVSDVEVMAIVDKHCASCHAASPSHESFDTPPKDMVLETIDDLHRHAELVDKFTVQTRTMPLGNETEMTDEERQQLGAWIDNR
jgi:DNA polymerase III sliding clamp (beta) subunit (PCNA family)